MFNFYIYKITNLLNSKVYIGQTNNFKRRWKEYESAVKRNDSKQIIITAMIKYGISNFEYEIIYQCESRNECNFAEEFCIKENNSLIPNGYNVEEGGNFAPQSKESLRKISEALKGRPSINKGVPCSEEQKLKTSRTMIGRKYSDERCENISNGLKGKDPWNKGKTKISETQTLLIISDTRKYQEIADEYGISKWMVWKIKNNRIN